jgi:hypothetical protein
MSDERRVLDLLVVVRAGDDSDEPVNNAMLADRLGWPLTEVAACLSEAKERSLVWGVRGGEKPAPWFNDLEITVQGRRLLRDHEADLG